MHVCTPPLEHDSIEYLFSSDVKENISLLTTQKSHTKAIRCGTN